MGAELSPVANAGFLSIRTVAVFDPGECDRILAAADPAAWRPAMVTDERDPGSVRPEVRSVLTQPVPTEPDGWPVAPLLDVIRRLNDEVYRFELTGWPLQDGPSVLRYEANVLDEFKVHRDVGAFSPTRKLSCVVQLTDPADYLGGDLVFPDEATVADRTRGAMVVFPSFLRHQVTPVLSGVRHALVLWVHGPTFR
jgi:PKHD-type hydroxylase